MSAKGKVCLFDNSKECPARIALTGAGYSDDVPSVLEKACPLCPIRMKMLKSS